MSKHMRRIVSVIACAVLAAVFIVIMTFCTPEISIAPQTTGLLDVNECDDVTGEKILYTLGEDVAAVRISDLGKLQKITEVNYVADRFVYPESLAHDLRIVDLTKPFEFAERGTLIFVVMNLDPESSDFKEQADKLLPFKIGDNWHFTFKLPKVFGAANVYAQSNLVARVGDIENYDFSAFNTSYNIKTEKYQPKTEETLIDLTFYTRRHALNPYSMVTVHYQSSGTAFSGIVECPLIGAENDVTSVNDKSQDLLIAFTVFAAVAFAVLIVLSLLKHTLVFVNEIVWIFGIVLMLFPRFILRSSTEIPLFWIGLSMAASFITMCGTLLAFGKNVKKIPVKYIAAGLMGAGAILAFIRPFVPFAPEAALAATCIAIKSLGASALLGFAVLAAFDKSNRSVLSEINAACIIAVGTIASLFIPTVYPVYYNSLFWLCVVTVILTFVGVFTVFRDTEKANAYLTANLHLEVERQLKDIRAVVTERDNLLQFVSHDMKKPLQSSESLIDMLIEREDNPEQTKMLAIVKQNNSRVLANLSEIGSYARFNYIAEQSQIVDLYDFCASLCEFHAPDCRANGIVLNNSVGHFSVYVKKQGLENAISNIILNSIEHAVCTAVSLSAKQVKNKIVLTVADNGKGIADGLDIFKPYVSEKSESNGLGLFICKNIIESMNGTLSYNSSPAGTEFYITLLMA